MRLLLLLPGWRVHRGLHERNRRDLDAISPKRHLHGGRTIWHREQWQEYWRWHLLGGGIGIELP
jgi:hypothetical protein